MADLAIVPVIHHDGVHDTYIDLALCRAKTRKYPPKRVDHILEELRVAAASDRARGVTTDWWTP